VSAVAQGRDVTQFEVVNGASVMEVRLLQRNCKEGIPMSRLPGFLRMPDHAPGFISVAGAAVVTTAALVMAGGCAHLESLPVPAWPQYVDPPGRVARLSFVQGSVSFQPAGSDDWAPADLNRPCTSGDQLWVTCGGRAELDLGSAAIRLDASTNFEILDLDDEAAQLKLSEGLVNVHLRRLNENETFEIDTPGAAISLLSPGEYRFDVRTDGNTTYLTVFGGDAEVSGTSQAFTVHAHQQARITGIDPTTYEITAEPSRDAFDEFCASRERRFERLEPKYVSPEVIGYQDLDEFGAWHIDATWGPVWVPRSVAAGWTPYRFGHWVWIEPWGWTWIDDTPWGFAPFHYGRWNFIDRGWCWIPGPLHIRPVYAPALVVFVGGGRPGFDFFFWIGGGAGVAWFPLGPREVYVPPYLHSRRYITNVNISNTVIINPSDIDRVDVRRQRYINRSVHGAITAVPRDAFVGGRPVSRSAFDVSPQQATETRIAGTTAPVAPRRESLSPPGGPDAGRGGVTVPRPPANQERRPVIVRRPPPAAPVPFEQKRPALDARPGKPPDRGSLDQLRRTQPQPQPQIRTGQPGTMPRQPIQRPSQPPPSKSEMRREQKNDASRSRAIQTEQRREQQDTKAGKRPPGKKE
jgi:hypothetical protein